MIIVKLKSGDNIDKALKEFKFKTKRTKLISKIRELSFYEKPSMKKRKMMQKAKYKQKLRDEEDI